MRVGADTSDYTAGLGRASALLSGFAMTATDAMNSVALSFNDGGDVMDGRLARTEARMLEFGASATKTAAGVGTAFAVMAAASAGVLGVLINTASTFEDAFADVRKTTDATEEQFFTLSRSIRDMSMEMPMAADEIAGVAAVAGQLGVQVDDIEDFTRVMVMMGTATNMSSEEAATSLAKLMNIMGTSNDDVDRLGATIVDLGNNLATTESDIVNLGQRLAGAGAQVGLSEDQVLSFAGALSSLGLRTEMAGTAFSRVMLEMNSAVIQGGDQLENFANVAGVSASEFVDAFEDDAAGAIMTFIEGLGDLSESGEDVVDILSDLGLGEQRVKDALLRASEGSDLLNESLERGATAWEENTALVDEAEERYSTFSAQLQILWNHIAEVARIIGTALMDALSGLISPLNDVLGVVVDLARRFEEAEGPLKTFITWVMLLTPAAFALASILSFIVAGIFGVYTAFVALASVMGISTTALVGILGAITAVVLKITALVTAVITAAVAIWYYWDEIASVAHSVVDSVSEAFDRFMSIVTDSEMTIGEKFDALTGNIRHKMAEAAGEVAAKAKEIGEALYDMIPEPVFNFIESATEVIKTGFEGMVSEIQDILSGDFTKIGEVFSHLIPAIIAYLIGGIPGVLLAAARYIPLIAETFLGDVDKVIDAALQIVDEFLTGLVSGVDSILEVGVEYITKFIEGFTQALPHVIEAVTTILITMVETIAEFLPVILEEGINLLLTILEGILEGLPMILETISQVILAIVAAISIMLPILVEAGIDLLISLISGIVEMLPMLIETAVHLIESLISTIIELLPVILEAGVEILLALIEGIVEALPALIEAAAELVSTLIEIITDKLPEIIEMGITVLDTLIEGIIRTLPYLIAAAGLLIAKIVETIIKSLPQIIVAGVEILWALIKGILSILGSLLEAGYTLISELLVEIALFVPELIDMGAELIGALISGALDLLSSVWNAAVDIGNEMTEGVASFLGDMVSIGGDLVNGMVRGIKDKADSAVQAAKDVGSNIMGGIKGFLGISSPSKLARDEVGAEYMNGILLGMQRGIKDVIKMQEEITEAAKPEDIELQDVNVGKVRGKTRLATQQIHAEVSRGEYESRQADNRILGDIRDELKKQKEIIIEMDKRAVGRIVEPEVTERQDRKKTNREKFA